MKDRSFRKKSDPSITKQLLLVLLFILACAALSVLMNSLNERKDSGLYTKYGFYEIPKSADSVYIGTDFIFVPNIDYEDIDRGSFSYNDYKDVPYASSVSISCTDGWSDLGADAKWHNCDDMPPLRVIQREGKQKYSAAYLCELRFVEPNTTYYLSIPDTNGLVKIYNNDNDLGFLWRRQNEWSPVRGFGYGFVPIIPDQHGVARIIITISTNVKIGNPGMLSYPSIIKSQNSLKSSIRPSLWFFFQFVLFVFLMVGGLIIIKTIRNRLLFAELMGAEILVLLFTALDANFIVFDAYTREIYKYVLFILINLFVFLAFNYLLQRSGRFNESFSKASGLIVTFITALAIVYGLAFNPPVTGRFPVFPEIIFIILTAASIAANVIFTDYSDDVMLSMKIIGICHIFFSINAVNNSNNISNIPSYTLFTVISNILLTVLYTLKYVINTKKLAQTSDSLQILVKEKTVRISEINQDLYETNQRLLANEEARKNVLSNVSHDLKTPITAIMGYAEILLSRRSNMPDEQKDNYLRNIIRRSEQMERIISDIVDLTRLESDANKFELIRISICEHLDEICMMYEADLEGSRKKLELKIPHDDMLYVMADPEKLSRVFENLISNAIHYSFEEALIEVNAFRLNRDSGQDSVIIEVRDNGIGIPENELPMIFDRFYRAKNSGQNIKGTGLGLSIVKTILDRHDASITAESAIGQGTVFRIEMKACG